MKRVKKLIYRENKSSAGIRIHLDEVDTEIEKLWTVVREIQNYTGVGCKCDEPDKIIREDTEDDKDTNS